MSLILERKPADLSAIPVNFQQNLAPTAPTPMRMMAARGMLPLAPGQVLTALYALSFDVDPQIVEATRKSLRDMPPDILLPVLKAEKHVGVLDWAADLRMDFLSLEAVTTNSFTDALTIARIVRHAESRLIEVVATNQVRLLASPVIIEQMYLNPNARASTIDRVIELAQRNNVDLSGIPGLGDAIRSGQDIFSGGLDADQFDAIVQTEAQRGEMQEMLAEGDDPEEVKEEEDEVYRSLDAKISAMSIAQKVRMATIGSREAVHKLVRDANKLVHMAAVRSPRATYVDAKSWAMNKSMPDGVISYIAHHRDWSGKYDVMKALVENPKTPLGETLGYLTRLRTNDLKILMSSRAVPMQVARQAKILYTKRTSSTGK
jgi:hypothetical protein